MLGYLLSMLVGFWMGISGLLYSAFYWIEEKWDLPITAGDSASSSHAKLQLLIQRVIEEALKLPALLDYSGIERDDDGKLPEFKPKTYEDLLATAILNKVIDRYQNDIKRSNGASSSGVHSGSSSPGDSGRGRRRRNIKRDSSLSASPEPSSLEPMSQDDYGHSDSSGHVTDTPALIKELHQEGESYSTDDDEPYKNSYSNPVDGALSNMNFRHKNRINFPEYGGDIVEMNDGVHVDQDTNNIDSVSNGSLVGNGDIYANNNSWEENWLFQKKKIKPSQTGPVPMVIPNSNTEYRALIGDKDVEDTSDLSDAASDVDESSSDIKHVLINSKTIIGGKNPDILLSLVDRVESINENTNHTPECSDVKEDVFNIKDENDNSSNVPNLVYKDNYNPNNEIDETTIENVNDKSLHNVKNRTRIALRSFLSSSLESDDTDSEIVINPLNFNRTPSIQEEDVFGKNKVNEATNLDVVDDKDNINQESLGNQQQESEYTETVTIPVQRHIDSLKRQHNIPYKKEVEAESEPPPLPPTPIPRLINNEEDEEIILPITQGNDSWLSKKTDEFSEENQNADNHIPGSIAEREHKKWLNAVPMANNPYSPEAIQSRLNRQKKSSLMDYIKKPSAEIIPEDIDQIDSSAIQQSFGEDVNKQVKYLRDYYVNDAKKSTGLRKVKPDSKIDTSVLENEKINLLARSTSKTSPAVTKTNKIPQSKNDVYLASPAIAEDVDAEFDKLFKQATKYEDEEQDIYVLPVDLSDANVQRLMKMTDGIILHDEEILDQSDSISSLDDIPRVYNVGSGKIISKIIEKQSQESKSIKSPMSKSQNSSRYVNLDDNKEKRSSETAENNMDLPSVKDLAKKFFIQSNVNQPNIKPKRRESRELLEGETINKTLTGSQATAKQPSHMHSLTARSISKEFRDELKQSMPAVTNPHPGGSKYVPNGVGEPVKGTKKNEQSTQVPPPGSLKNKLKFFEQFNKNE